MQLALTRLTAALLMSGGESGENYRETDAAKNGTAVCTAVLNLVRVLVPIKFRYRRTRIAAPNTELQQLHVLTALTVGVPCQRVLQQLVLRVHTVLALSCQCSAKSGRTTFAWTQIACGLRRIPVRVTFHLAAGIILLEAVKSNCRGPRPWFCGASCKAIDHGVFSRW